MPHHFFSLHHFVSSTFFFPFIYLTPFVNSKTHSHTHTHTFRSTFLVPYFPLLQQNFQMAANPPAEAPPPETLKYQVITINKFTFLLISFLVFIFDQLNSLYLFILQTLVFKVLIHCDGCTKRVKKILQGIDGIFLLLFYTCYHDVFILYITNLLEKYIKLVTSFIFSISITFVANFIFF